MAQYYRIIQNVDDIKHINLENCVIMNEDGTQFSPRSVNMTNQNQLNTTHTDKSNVTIVFVFMSNVLNDEKKK